MTLSKADVYLLTRHFIDYRYLTDSCFFLNQKLNYTLEENKLLNRNVFDYKNQLLLQDKILFNQSEIIKEKDKIIGITEKEYYKKGLKKGTILGVGGSTIIFVALCLLVK